MEEQVFFNHDGVKVTNARFIVDGHTYSVRNITSTVALTRAQKWMWAAVCVFMAVALFWTDIWITVGFLMSAGLFLYFGRPMHYVHLKTASGEVQATQSRDLTYVRKVVEALNEAIISQHQSRA